MLEFQKVNLVPADLLEHPLYQPLIFPSIFPLLKDSSPAEWIVYEARWQDTLVGLALTQFFREAHVAQLYSLVVEESYRQRGIGFALFHATQTYLVNEGCLGIGCEYEAGMPNAPALEKIIAHLGWLPPKVYMVRCHYDEQAHFHPPWFQPRFVKKLPSHIEIFPWNELSPQEANRIRFQAEQGVFLPYLYPFKEAEKIEYLNSLGIRFQDQVIGWNITHRIAPDTIRYSTLYIEKDYHLLGYAIGLLIESVRLQQEASIQKALFEINLKEIDLPWWHFVRKRLMPYADRVEKMKWAVHTFIRKNSNTISHK